MDRRDLEQIDRFLSIVGKASLFEYFGIDPEADAATVEEALKKRRAWAQGQQANPKFRSESLWIIKNMALSKRALIDEKGVRMFVDMFSAQYLNGVEIDYVSGVMGSGFTFKNPNATGSCGCGTSFTA